MEVRKILIKMGLVFSFPVVMFFVMQYVDAKSLAEADREIKKFDVIVLGVVESKKFKERNQGTYTLRIIKSNTKSVNVYLSDGWELLRVKDSKAIFPSGFYNEISIGDTVIFDVKNNFFEIRGAKLNVKSRIAF